MAWLLDWIPTLVLGIWFGNWPSATIREFLAILLEHSRANLVILIQLSLPTVIYLFNSLAQLIGHL